MKLKIGHLELRFSVDALGHSHRFNMGNGVPTFSLLFWLDMFQIMLKNGPLEINTTYKIRKQQTHLINRGSYMSAHVLLNL